MRNQRQYAALVGVCYGDAMGMPTEGLSQKAIHKARPEGIHSFLPSMNEQISERRFEAGTITDDSLHTLILVDVLAETKGNITSAAYVEALLTWYQQDPAAHLVIGPSTLKAIQAFQRNEGNEGAKYAVTNGCMMKIAPVGLVCSSKEEIIPMVQAVCEPTHGSNICLTCAAVIAYLISKFVQGCGIEAMASLTWEMIDACEQIGFDMPACSLPFRIRQAWKICGEATDQKDFMQRIYDEVGTGIPCIETLPAVLAIVKYTGGDIRKCASICASIGGDTDTIGSIACSLCGALGHLPSQTEIEMLEWVNHIQIRCYADKLMGIR